MGIVEKSVERDEEIFVKPGIPHWSDVISPFSPLGYPQIKLCDYKYLSIKRSFTGPYYYFL